MTKETKILFANDESVSSNEHLKQFIEHGTDDFSIPFIDGELSVVIKKVDEKKHGLDQIRMTAGAISRELSARKIKDASIDEEALSSAFSKLGKESVITAFAEGWNLGTYAFITYKSKAKSFATKLNFEGEDKITPSIQLGEFRAEAMAFSRDLLNEVPNVLNPETFPNVLEKEFADTNVEVTIFDEEKLKEQEMNGILTVGRGSKYKPAFVELKYEGDPSKPLVALVGKGVTFDTGGISLKSGRDLSDMRMDMGGAAAVSGAMKLLAATKAKVNVVGLIQIVENMPDNKSLLPGEVITYKNGHTVQVGNTDAEGRLILADGLIRAGELKAEHVVDIATLTGAVVNALGPKVAGVFGDEQLANEMKELGDENGDFVWPLPLIDDYDETLKSNYADFSNISTQGPAGSITAGLFLRRFVPETAKWLHVDMAGRMDGKQSGYYGNSGTGFGARLLADYTEHVSK